jgi:hypothetical protein
MSIGAMLSTILSVYHETLLSILIVRTSSISKLVATLRTPSPEGRLYFAFIESIFLPVGLFWFWWTQFGYIPSIVPTLAIGCATMGIFSIYLATFNYLANAYHRYASSALAAQRFCEFASTGRTYCFKMLIGLGGNLMGGIFPLIDTAMFTHLGFQVRQVYWVPLQVTPSIIPYLHSFPCYRSVFRQMANILSLGNHVILQRLGNDLYDLDSRTQSYHHTKQYDVPKR